MGGVLDRAATLFERRFLLNAFLPVLLLVGGGAAAALTGAGQMSTVFHWWSRLDGTGRGLAVLCALTLTWFAAGVMSSQFRNLTQLYEGYPLTRIPLLSGLGAALAERHFHTYEKWVGTPARVNQADYAYPQGDRDIFLPTALGNVLRSAERYPHDRYGIPTTFLWPRLFYVTPEHFRRDIEEFRTDYEWLLGVSFLSAVTAAASGIVLIAVGAPWWLFAATFGGGCLLSLLAYRASVAAAEEYGAQLRAGVDLYRTEVLVRLRWDVPSDLAAERHTWEMVRRFHVSGEAHGQRYPPYEPPPA